MAKKPVILLGEADLKKLYKCTDKTFEAFIKLKSHPDPVTEINGERLWSALAIYESMRPRTAAPPEYERKIRARIMSMARDRDLKERKKK